MLLGRRTVAHYVDDLDKARRGITDLVGRAPSFDEPYYTGFDVCRYELGVLPDMVSVGTYWAVDDLEREVARLVGLAAIVKTPMSDVCGEMKTATVTDPFGNVIGLVENPNFKTS